jgi:cystathionine gamma-synthase
MAAATAVFQALAPAIMCWCTEGDVLVRWQLAREFRHALGLRAEFIDMTDADALRRAIQPGRTSWCGSKRPPTALVITDIALTARLPIRRARVVAVDSTVATPVLTRPIRMLARTSMMHAATKY